MTRKTQKAYEHIFQFIDANLLELKPKTFNTDFEKGLRNAIIKIFPQTRLKGCWFHFCQALRRKLSKMSELAQRVKTTDEARRVFKKILVLPLLPPEEIPNAFNICKEEAYANNKCYSKSENIFQKFFDYFQHQWLDMVLLNCFCFINLFIRHLNKSFVFVGICRKIFGTWGIRKNNKCT